MPEAASEYVGNRWGFFLLTRRKAGRIAKIAKDNKRKPEFEALVLHMDLRYDIISENDIRESTSKYLGRGAATSSNGSSGETQAGNTTPLGANVASLASGSGEDLGDDLTDELCKTAELYARGLSAGHNSAAALVDACVGAV